MRVFLGLLLLSFSAQLRAESAPSRWGIDTWTGLAERSVRFFDRAWVPGTGGRPGSYRSNVAYDGTPEGEQRHLIALSRMAYGLAWNASWTDNTTDLYRAREIVRFIRERMTTSDTRFRSVVDGAGNDLTPADYVSPVNEQAYGLCGAVAVYRFTRDPELLEWIRTMYRSLVGRYRDHSAEGGFFDTPGGRTKSFASTVYVATSFLLDLYEVDEDHRENYAVILRELARHAYQYFLEPRGNRWIMEQFDGVGNFVPREPFRTADGDSVTIVGHNTQYAWFLMRIASLGIVPPRDAQLYRQRAQEVLGRLLTSSGVDRRRGGFYNGVIRETSALMWGTDKAWWQQAEGLLAYTLAGLEGLVRGNDIDDFLDKTFAFYNEHFVDRVAGGERQIVREDGAAIVTGGDSMKGHVGKSTYHTVELSRFMRQYVEDFMRTACSPVMDHRPGTIVLQNPMRP